MARAITGRITLNLVAGILLTVLTVTFAVSWMAQRQNEEAQRATHTMVVGGMDALSRELGSVLNDNGWRAQLYGAYIRLDDPRVAANMGAAVTRAAVGESAAIISPAGRVEYEWRASPDVVRPAQVLTRATAEEMARALSERRLSNTEVRTGFVAAPDGAMVVAFARLMPRYDGRTDDGSTSPIIVVSQPLSKAFLRKLGQGLIVSDFRFQSAVDGVGVSARDFFPVIDLSGKSIGELAWRLPAPGYAALNEVALPLGLAVLVFSIIAVISAAQARRLAVALTESEQTAVTASRTDTLTGLMNRNGFNQVLESEPFPQASTAGNLAMIYFDVNGFKAVNDSIGHHGGDELVKVIAERLSSKLPPGTPFARIGGDEFAVALVGDDVKEAAKACADALVHALDEPFTVCGFEFHVTAAIGYATANRRGLTPAEVLRRADLAMYQAKAAAEREAVLYHPSLETGALEKKQIEKALRRAIETAELTVVYQPIVRASDFSIVALEALVRWNSPEFGTISPTLFVPVAEEAGLIHDVGRFVLRQVCEDFWRWSDMRVTVNISPVQLRDPNFAEDLMALIKRHGVEPAALELELTEGILVNNPTIAKRKLAALKELGFGLSLDDFGTGFSSIGYLRQFPFDRLKVDRSFVREIGINPTANALIQSVVSLGDAMNLAVVAEGIENAEQLALLRLVQCEFIQGFFISKPITADEVTRLFAAVGSDRKIPPRALEQISPEVLAAGLA
jgi:diguanylate cyclase (GGDEF)-like protein